MSRGVQRARVDTVHPEIVAALRKAGICATSTAAVGSGFPDVVAGFRGINVLLEIKTGERDCDRKLTVMEKEFHDTWSGPVFVVSTAEEAITRVVESAQKAGLV